uniref:Uncharacterized protein n=1 Tax=Denticeps clupeoides TaxID=299321 RepID=A0A8C4A7H7_9TELE
MVTSGCCPASPGDPSRALDLHLVPCLWTEHDVLSAPWTASLSFRNRSPIAPAPQARFPSHAVNVPSPSARNPALEHHPR